MPNFLRPKDLEMIRFNQLRSHNVTTAPWNIAQAAEESMVGDPVPSMYLPQAMGFDKWKTPTPSTNFDFATSARQVATLADTYRHKAPATISQPVPFYQQADAAAPFNRLPSFPKHLSITEPISRGVLQRGEMQLANQEELRGAMRVLQDPPSAYDTQLNIHSRMFPSTYVFRKNTRPDLAEGSLYTPKNLRGLRGADPASSTRVIFVGAAIVAGFGLLLALGSA